MLIFVAVALRVGAGAIEHEPVDDLWRNHVEYKTHLILNFIKILKVLALVTTLGLGFLLALIEHTFLKIMGNLNYILSVLIKSCLGVLLLLHLSVLLEHLHKTTVRNIFETLQKEVLIDNLVPSLILAGYDIAHPLLVSLVAHVQIFLQLEVVAFH